MRTPVELVLVVLRMGTAAVLFTLLILGVVAYWQERGNRIVRYGGTALLILGVNNFLVGMLALFWSLTTPADPSSGTLIVSTIHGTYVVMHILLIILMLHLLGYVGVKVSPPEREL